MARQQPRRGGARAHHDPLFELGIEPFLEAIANFVDLCTEYHETQRRELQAG